MNFSGFENLAFRIGELESRFVEGAARCKMQMHGDQSLELDIEVFSDRFCSISASITEHTFDFTLGGKIGESDISHKEYDILQIVSSVVSGQVVINLYQFLNLNSSISFNLFDNKMIYFNSSQILIPLVNKYSKQETLYYDPYCIKG